MLCDVTLNSYQLDAVEKMKNGCILVGDTGSGKSRTALAYYFMKVCKAGLKINGVGKRTAMKEPRNLYIITTAKKRDSGEWLDELLPFCILPSGPVTIIIDSWNNIKKYKNVYGAFFIFDEQRLVGSGEWVKAFYDIARKNKWVLLSATPGDTWTDYIPVFVANGFYKDKTQFKKEHCLYSPFITKYPKLEGYQKEGILLKHKMDISIPLPVDRHTSPHHRRFMLPYDKEMYRKVWRDRWDPWEDEPIQETGKLMYLLRKVTNDDERRLDKVSEILKSHQRAIIFYNFSYELHKLRELCIREGYDIGEWNGEVHSSVPDTERWVYLVQYTAGCEGWNCITCNCMIFYSQSYSYRMTKQAEGRIDRMNTPFTDLYYYHLKSSAPVDLAISRALSQKKDFNERSFLKKESN